MSIIEPPYPQETANPKTSLEKASPANAFYLVDRIVREKIHAATPNISRRKLWLLYILCLIISDGLAIGLAFRAAFFFRFELSLNFFATSIHPQFDFYQRLVVFLIPLWLVVYGLTGLYNQEKLLGGTEEYSIVFNASTVGMFIVISVGFLDPTFIFARGWLLLAWVFAFLFVSSGRFFIRRAIYSLRKRGYFLHNAVMIGANNEGISLAEQLRKWRTSGLHILGFVDNELPVGTAVYKDLFVLGKVDELESLVKNYKVDELLIASSSLTSRDCMMDIFQRFGTMKNINLRMSSGLYEIITTGMTVKEYAYVPLVGINKVRLTGADEIFKMLLDYCVAVLSLIAIFPLFFLIALAIKLDSPGPIIHRRRVMGMNGKQFDAYKFRTMYVNGDSILEQYPDLKQELSKNHKLKEDPRVTRIGKILRKASLDELPQLFNVLKREMSMVGPRIIAPNEVEMYDRWDINLMTVHPGITGLWQVSGRSNISYDERVRLDMYYIRNWSIWLDLQILFQTLPAVLRGHGAY